MVIIIDLTLEQYLIEKDIAISNTSFRWSGELTDDRVLEQIILIIAVQNTLEGYYGKATRINSSIGKKVESIKVDLKRLSRDLYKLDEKKDKSSMDEFLLLYGEGLIKRGEVVISYLSDIDYIGLIKRSMKKNEICLGRVDESNLRVFERLEIGSIKGISYNLVEEDIYGYIKKIRRRNNDLDLKKFIDEFVSLSYLDRDSIEYIKILLSIPYDSLKYWQKYRQNKRELTPEDYLKNIREAMAYETNSLI